MCSDQHQSLQFHESRHSFWNCKKKELQKLFCRKQKLHTLLARVDADALCGCTLFQGPHFSGRFVWAVNERQALGAQEELGSPALAFTRAICEILALDTALEEEVAIVRRNLLRLIHVREFSPAAAFKVRPRHDTAMHRCTSDKRGCTIINSSQAYRYMPSEAMSGSLSADPHVDTA